MFQLSLLQKQLEQLQQLLSTKDELIAFLLSNQKI